MAHRFFLLRAVLPALGAYAGCAAFQAGDAAPGLNARERHALAESYYWKPDRPANVYSDAYFDRLFARALDPSLDGARAEELTSALALALAEAGDEAFASALTNQPRPVRRALARNQLVSYLWQHYGLHYPRTQALLERSRV